MKTVLINTYWYSPLTHLPSLSKNENAFWSDDLLFVIQYEGKREIITGFYDKEMDAFRIGFNIHSTYWKPKDVIAWCFAVDILKNVAPELHEHMFTVPDGNIEFIDSLNRGS